MILGTQTLLRYAPGLRKAYAGQLERLLLEQEIITGLEEDFPMLEGSSESLVSRHEVPTTRQFLISSFLLQQSFAYLNQQPEESLHVATGVDLHASSLVTTLVPVDLERATTVAAVADPRRLARILHALEDTGHHLTGVFHIHPGHGPVATRSSGTDRAYLERLAGRQLVFGIWSRDGFCRIETLPAGLPIRILGDGITKTGAQNDESLYHLSARGQSLLGHGARLPDRLVLGRKVVRPAGTD